MQHAIETHNLSRHFGRTEAVVDLTMTVPAGSVFALVGVLVWRPEIGLAVAWGVIIPLAPLLFLAAPGVWRNVCPLAALNQLPRLAGFTRGLVQTPRLKEYAYVIGMAALPRPRLMASGMGLRKCVASYSLLIILSRMSAQPAVFTTSTFRPCFS
jgi:hypothetical protein